MMVISRFTSWYRSLLMVTAEPLQHMQRYIYNYDPDICAPTLSRFYVTDFS